MWYKTTKLNVNSPKSTSTTNVGVSVQWLNFSSFLNIIWNDCMVHGFVLFLRFFIFNEIEFTFFCYRSVWRFESCVLLNIFWILVLMWYMWTSAFQFQEKDFNAFMTHFNKYTTENIQQMFGARIRNWCFKVFGDLCFMHN